MSPRRDIAMTTPEIEAFLGARRDCVVVSLDGLGRPDGTVGSLVRDGRRTSFDVAADDPLVALLDRDQRTCCVVEEFPSYYEIKGVMVHGIATRRPVGRASDRATYDLEVSSVVSFDFGKLLGPAPPRA
ncbi:MAG TPA: hypothetical protein VKV36_10370 [Acidimicrobiales bacterium]|nr:hypothetical protein [Acidimicrobiales bacterium]